MRIRQYAQNYSKNKAKEKTKLYQELMNKILFLENKQCEVSCDIDRDLLHNDLSEAKQKLEEYYDNIANGIIIRSKANWVEYGEKNTAYFSALEKLRKAKTIVRIGLIYGAHFSSD